MKKLRLIGILTFVILLLAMTVYAASEPTVYLSAAGKDDAAGTADAPLRSLSAAFHALPYGGKIVICGNGISVGATDLPAVDGIVTITSVGDADYRASKGGGAELRMSGNIHFRSAVKLENLDIVTTAKDLVFLCHGNYACFGYGLSVSTRGAEINLPGIVGGSTGASVVEHSYLEICSGSWYRVRGGARGTSSAPQAGDSVIVIRGGSFNSTFDLGGDSAMEGNVYLFVYGGEFNVFINGASAAAVAGDVYMSFYGGTFKSGIRAGRGGAVGGAFTVNFCTDAEKAVSLGTSEVAGGYTCNILDGKTVNTSLTSTSFSLAAYEELRTQDELFLAAFVNSILPQTEIASIRRDFTVTGSTARSSGLAPVQADADQNGRLSLHDALLRLQDGNVQTAVAVLEGAVQGKTALSALPAENTIAPTLSLCGATVRDGKISGGTVIGVAPTGAYTLMVDVTFAEKGIAALYFGCDRFDDSMNGYCFQIDPTAKTATVYRLVGGTYRQIGKRTIPVFSDAARIQLDYGFGADQNGVSLYYDDNPLTAEPYPIFNLQLDSCGDQVGVYVENATATLPICFPYTEPTARTYTNTLLTQFTDVEIYFEDGRYYIFGTSGAYNEGVQCYSTTNFRTYRDEGFALAKENVYGDGIFKAANILKADGKYYMFYMTEVESEGTSRTAYAVADKLTGPYMTGSNGWMRDAEGEYFIGGQPFADADGSLYLIYARVGGGNTLYGAKMTVADGKVALSASTKLLAPTEPWENAKAAVVECGYIVKHNGLYYMLYSGGNYNSTYGTGYAIAESPLGPYTKYAGNPIMTSNDQAYGVGAATVFTSPDGSEHFIAYIRSFSQTVTRPLSSCIDRIRFVRDPNGGVDHIEIAGPTVTPQPLPSGLGGEAIDFDYQYTRFIW